MKRVLLMISLLAVPLARGQETPTAASLPEIAENYKILQGHVQDLQDANTALKHQLDDMQAKIDALTAQAGKPAGNFASQDDVKALKDAIEAVDKKRMADNDEVLKELKQIAKLSGKSGSVTTVTPRSTPATPPAEPVADTPQPDGPGFMYEVKSNDTPNRIAKKLLEEKGIKITGAEIMAANPKVKDPTKLIIGQKLFIPAPKTAPETADKN
ncbi:MAG TPA: LysM peptidoglycan-binding domain-containing protein [Verrucomicrobiae bacterium]|nr:LysM peptidoglycan-binding domain-containing protein [Verrucomicrobiae bacterium]